MLPNQAFTDHSCLIANQDTTIPSVAGDHGQGQGKMAVPLDGVEIKPKANQVWMTAWAICQAEAIGGIVAAGYKALTGRAHPAHGVATDLTRVFRFGLLRGGVFWGFHVSGSVRANLRSLD